MTETTSDRATPTSGIEELARRRALAAGAARADRVRRQHERGGLTGPERIELLVDAGSFIPLGRMLHADRREEIDRSLGGDGALHGIGEIDGRPVAVLASDPTVKAATGSAIVTRYSRAHERLAQRWHLPYLDLRQGGGARITEIMTSRFAGNGGASLGSRHAFERDQIYLAAVLGDYYPPWNMAQSDVIVMCATACAAMTSPPLLEAATGQIVTAEELGGADVHGRITGQVDAVLPDERQTILALRTIFGYLPTRPRGVAPVADTTDPVDRIDPSLRSVLPENPNRAYDVRDIVTRVVDAASFFEFSPDFAPNLVTGLARLGGRPVALLANQPRRLAGTLDVDALAKAERLFQLADIASLPLLSIIDTPGILTTKDQEHARIVRQIYRSAVARIRASVPKLHVVVRKGIGFGYFSMGGSDVNGLTFAWPSARIAFTGPEPGARIVHHRALAGAEDPKALLASLAAEVRDLAAPWSAAELGYLDAVIDPAETRPVLIRALHALAAKGHP